MPSVASVAVFKTAFTLSFGGVDFRLDPQDVASQVSFQRSDDGVFVNLKSFTGMLHVASSSSFDATHHKQSTTAKVEEEGSPDTKPSGVAKQDCVSPGQTKLAFAKATAKNKAVIKVS